MSGEDYKQMSVMTTDERDLLAGMQLSYLEVAKTPVSAFDVAIKSYVDSKFDTAVGSATAAVTALIDSAPAQLDTLKEIADALGNDANLASTLTNQIGTTNAAITTEVGARSSADTLLEQKITAEANLRIAADATEVVARDAAILVESDRAKAVEEAVDLVLIAHSTAHTNASVERAAEVTARTAAVASLRTDLNNEVFARGNAITDLTNNKFDKSIHYSGGTTPLKIAADSYLYIGDLWRIRANNTGVKRLEFQYSASGMDADFKTAVPFVRGN